MAEIKIRLMKSAFYKEKRTKEELAKFVLEAPFFSMGEQCRKFEEDFAKKQGRKFAVFLTSGSSANLVLIQGLINLGRLKKGDKVGFSALTWSTNVMPLIQLGLIPVPLDCSLKTLNVSPAEVERKADDIKGIFLTNTLGFSDDIEKIRETCRKKNIVFLEDNCESMGSEANGIKLGNFSLASTFSFFIGHHMSTIEGGMILTDDPELYNMLLMTRIHGWDRNLPEEEKKKIRDLHGIDEFYSKYAFYDLAYNARPTEINGFLGNSQLPYWDEIVFKREGNFKLFQYVAGKNEDLFLLDFPHMNIISNFAYPVIAKDKEKADFYKRKMEEAGVEIRPIIAGDITKQPFFKKHVSETATCPNADFIHKNGFYFGNNPEMNREELGILCNTLEKKQ